MLNGMELLKAIKLIQEEKQIDREVIISGIKEGFQKAYEKFFDTDAVINVELDETTGNISMSRQLIVVENVEDDWLEVSLSKAKETNPDIKIGDVIFKPVQFNEEFSRLAINQVRQIFQQKIRGAERTKIYEKFISSEGEIVQAKVVGMNKDNNYVLDIDGAISYLWRNKTIDNEIFQMNEIIDVYIEAVLKENKHSQLTVSRTAPDFLYKLIEREVPEVRQGLIQIKAISRVPGKRAKVAVVSLDQDIEPIGSIVGVGGSRINKISQQLKGEKIDVIRWEEDPSDFIINAMSPVKVISVNKIDEGFDVIVPDSKLLLAIGKEGIAVKLVANLLKTKINIYSLSRATQENMLILWNGNLSKDTTETQNTNKKPHLSTTITSLKKEQFNNNNGIDLDALAAFQAEVDQEQNTKEDNVIEEQEVKLVEEPINKQVFEQKEIEEVKPQPKQTSSKKQKNENVEEVEFTIQQDPDIDEIVANLEAFNDAINEDEEDHDLDEDLIDEYDKYYE